MSEDSPYDPLEYSNLTINLVRELMSRGPFDLPLKKSFQGPGVYALFYNGDFKAYKPFVSLDASRPIYVGKAVLPGARKGGTKLEVSGTSLLGRIKEHVKSISAAENLRLEDFTCRYLVVVPLWITMAERFLIEHYRPIWNVCIEGFGLHDPGGGRRKGEGSWWDVLHPGRSWAAKQVLSRTRDQAEKRIEALIKGEAITHDVDPEETSEAGF